MFVLTLQDDAACPALGKDQVFISESDLYFRAHKPWQGMLCQSWVRSWGPENGVSTRWLWNAYGRVLTNESGFVHPQGVSLLSPMVIGLSSRPSRAWGHWTYVAVALSIRFSSERFLGLVSGDSCQNRSPVSGTNMEILCLAPEVDQLLNSGILEVVDAILNARGLWISHRHTSQRV